MTAFLGEVDHHHPCALSRKQSGLGCPYVTGPAGYQGDLV